LPRVRCLPTLCGLQTVPLAYSRSSSSRACRRTDYSACDHNSGFSTLSTNSHITTTLYDSRARVLSTHDPLGAYVSYVYDPAGNQILRTDSRNWLTTYAYDPLNRQSGYIYNDGQQATFAFDSVGQRIVMADWTGITSYSYDADGRQQSVAYPTGKTLTYGYDPNGNRTTLVDPDGGLTTYAYDAGDNLIGIANPFAEVTTIAYDPLNRETRRTMANGVVTSHTFDPAGNELTRTQVNAEGVAVLGFTATYDPVGNRLAVEEVDGNRVSYSYDPTSQLLSEERSGPTAVDTTYTYDPLGNRLMMTAQGAVTTYAYNAANALTLITPPTGASTTQTYDANGNLIGSNAGGAMTTYTWDGENRMISRIDPVNGRQDSVYDATGIRTKLTTSATTINFLRDGLNVLAELDVFLNTVAQYTDNPGYWGGMTSQRRGTQSSFYGFDLSANTRLLTSAKGTKLAAYLYDAFGVELSEQGFGAVGYVPGMSPGFGGLFRPAAQLLAVVNYLRLGGQFGYWGDSKSEYYVRARIDDAVLGRWLSRDPFTYDWNLNRYVYAANAPSQLIDPFGLWPISPGGGTKSGQPGDYGYHCGANVYGPHVGAGKQDCIDNACEKHDNCLNKPVTYSKCPSLATIAARALCDTQLCDDAIGCVIGCNSWQCQVEAGLIRSWFCPGPTGLQPIGSGPIGPGHPTTGTNLGGGGVLPG